MVLMAILRSLLKRVLLFASAAILPFSVTAPAQSLNPPSTGVPSTSTAIGSSSSTASTSLPGLVWPGSDGGNIVDSADPALPLPDAPDPAAFGGREKYDVTPAGQAYQRPFSRIGIGVDVNTLGIGIKSAIVLNHAFDARLMGNLFFLNIHRFEIEGFNATGNVHMASAAASLDWYPFSSVWRISPGLLFYNANQITFTTQIASGTSFSLNGQTFFSANTNPVTGATPLTGTGILGLHTTRPAVTLAGGFGKFIPRSNRHWSFPSEFGVAFTGGPSANVTFSGWACLTPQQTICSNVGNSTNPVAIVFNNALQASLTKWRFDLNKVQVYPLFSYSAVYSFNIR
jgi:hypothetical protein